MVAGGCTFLCISYIFFRLDSKPKMLLHFMCRCEHKAAISSYTQHSIGWSSNGHLLYWTVSVVRMNHSVFFYQVTVFHHFQ